jgi:hypothetical protein
MIKNTASGFSHFGFNHGYTFTLYLFSIDLVTASKNIHFQFFVEISFSQKYDKEVTVQCVYNEKDGSHWRFKDGDSFIRAKCRRGKSLQDLAGEDSVLG